MARFTIDRAARGPRVGTGKDRMNQSLALTFVLIMAGVCPALAARDPLAPSRKCRTTIAKTAGILATAGLKSLDACHARRDGGRFNGDCNALDTSATFSSAASRAGSLIGGACPADSPVLGNYAGGDPKAAIVAAFLDALEDSGQGVQGDPAIAADRTERTAHAKCHGAIGKARSAIVQDIVRRATACQKKLDRQATAFLGLAPSCDVGPGAPAARARTALARACKSLQGAEVGSCAPLPDCVIAAATETGSELAQATYGATPTTVTTTTVPTTSSTSTSMATTTSTSTTSTSVTTTTSTSTTSTSTTTTTSTSTTSTSTTTTTSTSTTSTSVATTTSTSTTSTSTTTTTIAAVCGDHTVQAGETCDDGNAVDESDPQVPIIPTDNCPKTCVIGACGAGSPTAQVVSVNFALPQGAPTLFGITVFLDYPDAKAEMTGSGSAVTGSLSNVNPGALNSPNDLDYGLLDGMVSFAGLSGSKLFDLTLQRCAGLPPLVAGDFKCLVKDASDQFGSTVAGVTCSVSIP